MGRSRTWTYRIEFKCVSGYHYTPQEWRVKDMGKPTPENIDKWVAVLEDSMKPGGCNAHLGQDQVVSAQIFDQRKRTISPVANWTRKQFRPNQPMFEGLS